MAYQTDKVEGMLKRLWWLIRWGCDPHIHKMEFIAANTRACKFVDSRGRRCNAWDGEQAWT